MFALFQHFSGIASFSLHQHIWVASIRLRTRWQRSACCLFASFHALDEIERYHSLVCVLYFSAALTVVWGWNIVAPGSVEGREMHTMQYQPSMLHFACRTLQFHPKGTWATIIYLWIFMLFICYLCRLALEPKRLPAGYPRTILKGCISAEKEGPRGHLQRSCITWAATSFVVLCWVIPAIWVKQESTIPRSELALDFPILHHGRECIIRMASSSTVE
jgi:hypothetical protein